MINCVIRNKWIHPVNAATVYLFIYYIEVLKKSLLTIFQNRHAIKQLT